MGFIAGFQLGMMGCTLLFYQLIYGWVTDYEEFCTRVGASFLWFITWPLSVFAWWQDRQWRKQIEKEHKQWDER